MSHEIEMDLARNPETSKEVLEKLAQSKDWRVRIEVAENPNTSPKTLEKLLNDKDEAVICGVARNPNTPPEIFKKLAQSEDWQVKVAVIENENTPEEVIKLLSKDKSIDVKFAIANREEFPDIEGYMVDERLEIEPELAPEGYDNEIIYIVYPVNDTDKPLVVKKDFNLALNKDYEADEGYHVKTPLDEYMEGVRWYVEKAIIAHELSDTSTPHSLYVHEEILKVFPYEEPKDLSPEDLEIYKDCAQSVHENLLLREEAEPKIYESLIKERKQASESEEQSMGR